MRSTTWWTAGTAAALALMGGCVTSALADTGAAPMNASAKRMIENALSCVDTGKFEVVEAALNRNGWRLDQGTEPVQLAAPLKVFGLSTTKIVYAPDGDGQVYRSFLRGVSLPQVVKAASLKLGKDKKGYGRVTKMGLLTAEVENGETILTCTVEGD